MAIRNGVCPICGSVQNVNSSLRAAVCTVCGNAYVVTDALGARSGDAAEFLRKGKSYLRIGAGNEAIKCFMEGLALDPANDELKIFYYGFRYFDAEDYIKRHPFMEPFEYEYLYLHTDKESRREYFMRFFDGSVYEKNPQCSYKPKLIRRRSCIVDSYRCDAVCRINGGLPAVWIYATDAPGGLRSPEQVEYLFAHDTGKTFRRVVYQKKYYQAQSKTIFVTRKSLFGGYTEDKVRKNFPEVNVSRYDVIAGTCDLRERAAQRFYGEEIPFEFRVDPNPEIARLIRKYYPE